MGCLLPFVAIFAPRLVMFFIFLLTNWFASAYQTVIWPLLGFLFMPYTTLAYMAAIGTTITNCQAAGLYW